MDSVRIHRSERATLPPDNRVMTVLRLDGLRASEWRVIETYSESMYPYELELQWSSGTGVGPVTRLTVPGSARICILARSCTISARNLHNADNPVTAHVADGCIGTANVWVHLGSCEVGIPVQLPIPSFAQSVRIELESPTLRSSAMLEAKYGTGTSFAVCSVLEQPPAGLLLGGCTRLELTTTAATHFRALYFLTL